jgi:hypothetical protein
MSVLGLVIAILFVVLAVAVIIPTFGVFGILWTVVAGGIGLFYAYNFFNNQGVSVYDVNVDSPDSVEDLDVSLRKLAKLRDDGLITDQEYEQKRTEVLRRR